MSNEMGHVGQCCGMPLYEEEMISREPNGRLNEDYCKWCYVDGKFTYDSMDKLIDYLVAHMPNPENTPEEERREMFAGWLSQLKYWQKKQ